MYNFEKILFIDIETVSHSDSYENLSSKMQKLWDKKANTIFQKDSNETSADLFVKKGAIYSEFGKVVTISLGKFFQEKRILKIKSFCEEDEKKLLIDFINFVDQHNSGEIIFCGHNIKEFDIPYLCRRILVNGIKLPIFLDLSGKKPWEVKNLDTMEMWSFGDRKNFTSLDLLTTIFGIESSKSDMDGSDVHKVFYEEKNFERLKEYCSNDVIATTNLFLKMKGYDQIKEVSYS